MKGSPVRVRASASLRYPVCAHAYREAIKGSLQRPLPEIGGFRRGPAGTRRRLRRRNPRRRVQPAVVDDDDRLVGILAQADGALAGDDERAGEVVEEISRPTEEARP